MPGPNPFSVGQALTQPVVPARGAPAPEEQMNLWQKFRQKLGTDPNFRMALLTSGLNMLRSPGPGQSGFDTFAQGALAGVSTLDQLRQRDEAKVAQAEETEFKRAATTRGLDTRDRATDIAARNADTSAARVLQSQQQFEENLQLGRDRLNETKRQFDVAASRGGTTNSPVTGQERLTNAGIEALVVASPDIYPNTPEGRAKARLIVQGIGASGQDPQAQARIMASIFSDLQKNNVFADKPLEDVELMQRAMQLYQTFSGDLNSPAAEPADDLDGQELPHPIHGTGKITRVGENKYVIDFPGGTSGEVSGEQIRAMLGTDNAN